MVVATCVLKKVWGRGFKRIACTVVVDEKYDEIDFIDKEGHVVEWLNNDIDVNEDNLNYAFAYKNVMYRKGWFISEYKEVANTETEKEATETEKEVIEAAIAKLDSVVRTQHTTQVDRFYIHNYKNGVTRLYWLNKSALACGFKVIVNRNGIDTVVRNERFRSFITWEQHRESYTKYCKSVALKGGE